MSFDKTLRRNLAHAEAKIEESHLDLDMKIESLPTKFKGIITKNQKSYNNALKAFSTVQQAMDSVR